MNRWHTYSAGNFSVRAPQIETLEHIGLFGDDDIDLSSEHLVDPHDNSESLERRARSYLHANCASCHVVSGGGNSRLVLSFPGPLEKMNLLDEQPLHGTLGLSKAKLLWPGVP